MGWPEHRLPHRVLSMGPLHGILMESPGKKSSVLSKARCSSGVVDTGQSPSEKDKQEKKRVSPPLCPRFREDSLPCPYSNFPSRFGPMVPANPFPASRQGFCSWLEKSEASVLRGLSFLQFPGVKDKGPSSSLRGNSCQKERQLSSEHRP